MRGRKYRPTFQPHSSLLIQRNMPSFDTFRRLHCGKSRRERVRSIHRQADAVTSSGKNIIVGQAVYAELLQELRVRAGRSAPSRSRAHTAPARARGCSRRQSGRLLRLGPMRRGSRRTIEPSASFSRSSARRGLAEADGQLLLRQENTRRAHRPLQAGDRLIGRSGGSGSCIVVRSRLRSARGAHRPPAPCRAHNWPSRPAGQGAARSDPD